MPVASASQRSLPGRPIKVSGYPAAIAITADGKTVYIAGMPDGRQCSGTVTPVATATTTPGQPIKIGRVPEANAITH